MYSVMKKNIENSDIATKIAVTFAPVSVRLRKIRNGTSGALMRSSTNDEGRDQRQRDRDQAERLGRAPAGVGGVDERVDRGCRGRP